MSLREQKKRKARQDILTAASKLIDQHGYEQAKMRDIAAAAHVSYQTLYNYFPTKALILQAVLTADVEEIVNRIEKLIDNFEDDLLSTLVAVHKTRLEVVSHRDRELWRVVSIDLLRKQPEAGQIYRLIDVAARENMLALLTKAQETGRLDPAVDTELLGAVLVAIGQQAFSQYLIMPSMSKSALLTMLQDQTRLLVQPYLR